MGLRDGADIPLVGMKDGMADFCRTTSCFGDPEENALKFLMNDDQIQMRNLLAEICPIEDGALKKDAEAGKSDKGKKGGKPVFPLPEDHWINQPYGQEQGYQSLLQLAIRQGKEDFVKAMLSAGARADLYNENLGQAPIHVAAEVDSLGMLQILLDFMDKKPTLNKANLGCFDKSGQTVLHIAAAKNSLALLRYILGHQDLKDVDPKDLKGSRTPLYMAAKNSHAEAVELLIAHGANLGQKCFGKTVQDLITENMPYFDTSRVKVIPKVPTKWNLCEHLNTLLDKAQRNMLKHLSNAQNHLEFVIYLQQVSCRDFNNYDAQGMGLFQKACTYGLHDHVLTMLENRMDPGATAEECSSSPALLAAYGGFYKVLQILKDHKTNKKVGQDQQTVDFSKLENGTRESILHWVLKKTNPIDHESCNYEKSLQVLLSPGNEKFEHEITKIVNHKDSENNTPLHYATQLWDQGVVRQLLELGGNIGMRNHWEETPISLIMPETMEAFLDDFCLKSSKEVTHSDFELEFNYSFLAPPVDDPNYDENDPEGQKIVENAALPETESLWYMSQSKHHRHLLQHPVIMSFLWLKWQRIRGYFNRNVRFYLMFVVCLSWYIFERFGGISSRMTRNDVAKNSTELSYCSALTSRVEEGVGFWYGIFIAHAIVQALLILRDWRVDCLQCDLRTSVQLCFTGWLELLTMGMIGVLLYFRTQALWLVLTVLLVLLMLRELFQMSASLKRYLVSPENWLEMAMIALIGVILWVPDESFIHPCEIKRHLAAIAVVLSWAELITLIARHPKLSRYNIYVTMFYKVMQTFFFFLLWYCFFIIAFGFGFYIMLHKDIPGHNPEEDDYTFFNYPWLTLIKTSTMFVGEIEFADIPVDLDKATTPVIGYLFLLSFVFLIVVVLMNLLNGLAVSDTGMIREKAEIVSAISRVETISYIESLFLGDPFDFLSNWPPFNWIKSIPSLAFCRCIQRNSVVRDISHKITGATGILLFYSMLPSKTMKIQPNKRNYSCIASRLMSAEVIQASKAIVIKKMEERRWKTEKVDLENQIDGLKGKVESMEDKLNKIMGAFNIK